MTVHTWADNDRLYAADLNNSFISVNAADGVRVTRSAVQSLTTSVEATIAFDSEVYDYGGYHSNVTNNNRLTVPAGTPGRWYMVGASVSFASNATGYRYLHILTGGTVIIASDTANAVNGNSTQMTICASTYLTATQYVELRAYQTSGGNLNVELGTEYSPIFWLVPMKGT